MLTSNRARLAGAVVGWMLSAALAQAQSWLPGDAAVDAAAGDQVAPAVARGNDMVLAAWSDRRSYPIGSSSFYEFETSADIYAMRLDAAGNPLDSVPLVVTQERATQLNPKISWNGSNWLVVFESTDLGGTGFYYEQSLEAVRVSPSGQVLDSAPIKIRNVRPSGSDWAVTSDGTDWVLAFQSSAATTALQAMRITAAGVVEQPSSIVVPATYFMRSGLRLACASGVYLLTWSDFSDTMSIRFGSDLVPLDAAPRTLIANGAVSGLVASATQFYVVWHKQLIDFSVIVAGKRVSTAGLPLDGNGVNISGTSTPGPYAMTSLAWDGTQFRVSWGDTANQVRLGRVSAAGAVLDPNGVAVPGPQSGVLAATANGGVQLTWANLSPQFLYDVLSANVSAGNAAGPNLALSNGAPQQNRPDAAVGSGGYMVAFRSDTSGLDRVMAQPLDAAGNPTTAEPLTLAQGDPNAGLGSPTVAWNGSVYLATWANASGIVAQRLRQDGTPIDAAPVAVMPGFGQRIARFRSLRQ